MTQSNNRTEMLTLLRSMKSGVRKAIDDGYLVNNDESKLNLLKTAHQTRLLTELRKYWQLRHGCDLPNDQLLLETPEVKDFFSSPEKTFR